MFVTIDVANQSDEAFLWLMLTYAASMGSGGAEQVPAAKADPYLRCYVNGFGAQPGDLGVVCRNNAGEPLGAAWLRLGDTGGPFKLGDDKVPELATAVVPLARGMGVGTQMINALVAHARPQYTKIILSVRAENPAVRFYERLGFAQVRRMNNRVGGDSVVMELPL